MLYWVDTLVVMRYDRARRKRAVRKGAERGCWIFLPADELRKTGIDPHGSVPWYRVWGSSRKDGGLTVRLYREP